MQVTPKRGPTIVEALLELKDCTGYGARFVRRSGEATFYPYCDVLARARAAAGRLQARGLRPGDCVTIILPTCIEFLDVFLGVQLAGGIPAAVYPPLHLGKLDEYFGRTRRMLQKVGARLLVTDRQIRRILGAVVADVPTLRDVLDATDLGPAGPWTPVVVNPESPALLQFSSGTTLEPKAVMISHANLLSNLDMIDGFFRLFSEAEAARGGVCWLPLYHDMGLIGHMFIGLYHPGTVTYIGPELFLARPKIWFETLSRYKAVISAAPDFAYGLCLSKVRDEEMAGLDLSHWKIAFNGAEPIDVDMMQRFCDRFAAWGFRPEAMTPAYGLSEAGLAVTVSDPHLRPLVTEFDRDQLSAHRVAVPGRGRRLPAVGPPVPGVEMQLRDDQGQALRDGRVGRVMVRGSSITRGYYNDPELSARTIRSGWLDTGDLGFLYGGNLYIAGRAKDLIIIRGRNYAPQEIERLLVGLRGLNAGCWVAVGCQIEGHGEQLILLAERESGSTRPDAEVVGAIKERILAGVALTPYDVRLLAPGTLPRTSSGKLRRSEALHLYETERLSPPGKVNLLKLAKEVGKSQLAWSRLWLRRVMRRRPTGDHADLG
jgi:acyl-CoA synthetase (AMP-forming)/AMP-acid ligase II